MDNRSDWKTLWKKKQKKKPAAGREEEEEAKEQQQDDDAERYDTVIKIKLAYEGKA